MAVNCWKRSALDTSKKINHLSKGMRAQAGLIAAVAHRPDLLLLDEPSTGLDAVVRRDILNEIIRAVADDGRTAIFSSHLLDEVEMMSDHVFMIDGGKLVLDGSLDDIKARHQQLSVRYYGDTPPCVEGILSAQRQGDTWSLVCNGTCAVVHAALHEHGNRGDQIAACLVAGNLRCPSRSRSDCQPK